MSKQRYDTYERLDNKYNSGDQSSPASTGRTLSQVYLKRHFTYFAIVASLNHALAYVVVAYASSVLDGLLASIILGLSWMLNAFSGLFITTAVTKYFGFKISMIISLWGYTLQIISVYISILRPDIAWPLAITGSVISGLTSAVWWTAQGICFETTCILLDEFEQESEDLKTEYSTSSINVIRANLSAQWTLIYQAADIVVFLSLSIFPLYCKIDFKSSMFMLLILGVTTSLLGMTFNSLGHKGTKLTASEMTRVILAVPTQFSSDVRATLIAPFVFGFGITTAMFAYYVNGTVTDSISDVGVLYIGLLEAFSYFVAILAAFPYAYVSNHMKNGSHWVMQFGSLSFMLSGLIVLVLSEDKLSSWQNLLIIRGLYGLGRGVFEGACRAVYAELFHGESLSTAFSAQTLLAGLSGGLCFFFYNILSRRGISFITVFNGVIALLTYSILMALPNRESPMKWKNFLSLRWCNANSNTNESTEELLISADTM